MKFQFLESCPMIFISFTIQKLSANKFQSGYFYSTFGDALYLGSAIMYDLPREERKHRTPSIFQNNHHEVHIPGYNSDIIISISVRNLSLRTHSVP